MAAATAVARQIVPPQGTLPRCNHSVYRPMWVKGKNENPYCSCCDRFGVVPGERLVELPSKPGAALNAGHREHGSCPRCYSNAHYAHGNIWICAECHKQFPAPRIAIQRAQIQEMRKEEERMELEEIRK